MGFSKAKLYNKEDQITSDFARAFGYPARLIIMRKLSKDGPCTVKQLSKDHPISKAALSDHLKILRNANLITFDEKFPNIIYSLNGKYVTLAEAYFKSFFQSL